VIIAIGSVVATARFFTTGLTPAPVRIAGLAAATILAGGRTTAVFVAGTLRIATI
jgi:hypothetical protein